MTALPLSSALEAWNTSPTFINELSARLPYVYRPGDGGGTWLSTSEALAELLGWPPEWEARVEEAQDRADAACPGCAFLDVRGRDPRRPQDVRGTTIAVSDGGAW